MGEIKLSDVFANIVFPLSTGGAGGFLIGYVAKKIVKILVFFLGLYAFSLFSLAHMEVIEINSEKLAGVTSSLLTQTTELFSTATAFIPFSGSFVTGFALGMMKG